MRRIPHVPPLLYFLVLLIIASGHTVIAAAGELRVGVFDSRAVALAYAKSDMFEKWLDDLMSASANAQAAGDSVRLRELEGEAQAEHALRSKQVFGTFPAYDVLDKIKKEIPRIAQEAGVEVLVSKWDIVYQIEGAEYIDVTEPLVDLFGLNEKDKQKALDIDDVEPVPWTELDEHD